MSLLDKKVLAPLAGMREATVKSFREIENDKGGYVEVIFNLSDREYTYCVFPSQIEYVTSTLRTQFEVEGETNLGEMLTLALTKTFKVWFNYNYDLGRMNVALHQPREVVSQEEAMDL